VLCFTGTKFAFVLSFHISISVVCILLRSRRLSTSKSGVKICDFPCSWRFCRSYSRTSRLYCTRKKKPYPSANFSTTNHTWTVFDLEPVLHVEKRAFAHPCYDTTNPKYLIRQYAWRHICVRCDAMHSSHLAKQCNVRAL